MTSKENGRANGVRTQSGAAPDRAEEIYLAAAEIISSKGFGATSMNDIAKAVDLTKPGLYHYIQGKQDLLFEIMKYAMDRIEADVVGPAMLVNDPEQRLRTIVNCHARLLSDNGRHLAVLAEEVSSLAPQHKQLVKDRKRAYVDFVRHTLESLLAEGKLNDLDATVAAFNILGTLNGIARWFRPGARMTGEDVAVETEKLLMCGLLRPEIAAQEPELDPQLQMASAGR